MNTPTIQQAYEMGAKGGTVSDDERLAFESWMNGHCWALDAKWDGAYYVGGKGAMLTRMLWAAWRDRAALANMGE